MVSGIIVVCLQSYFSTNNAAHLGVHELLAATGELMRFDSRLLLVLVPLGLLPLGRMKDGVRPRVGRTRQIKSHDRTNDSEERDPFALIKS